VLLRAANRLLSSSRRATSSKVCSSMIGGTRTSIHSLASRSRVTGLVDRVLPASRVRFVAGRASVRAVLPNPAVPAYAGLRSIPHTVVRSQRDLPPGVATPCACSQRHSLAIDSPSWV
jgi:hypothetical protein